LVITVYTAKDAYRKLYDNSSHEDTTLFTTLWAVRILPSTQYFGWKVMLNRITTKVHLR